MDDLFKILRLLEVRIDDLYAASALHPPTGAPSPQALYCAQGRALQALAWDLAAAMVPDRGSHVGRDTRRVLLREMGGQTSATIIDGAYADEVGERFAVEHSAILAQPGEAMWNIRPIDIPPLDPGLARRPTGLLDMRWVLITWMNSALGAMIYNSEADLAAAVAEFRERYEFEIEEHEVSYNTHAILIPPRGSAHGAGPSGPHASSSAHEFEDVDEIFLGSSK